MVRVEVGDAERKGVWIDGYRPERERVIQIVRSTRALAAFAEDVEDRPAWNSFAFLADHFWEEAFEEADSRKQLASDYGFQPSDVLVVRPSARPFTEARLNYELNLTQHLGDPVRNSRFCILIFTYCEFYWPTASWGIGEVLRKLEFEETREDEYAEPDRLRKFAKEVAEVAITPYCAPSRVAYEYLQRMGFRPLPGQYREVEE